LHSDDVIVWVNLERIRGERKMKNKLVAIAMLAMLLTVFIPISLTEASGSGGLGGFWYLDEGTGTTTYDSSGNGNHGTVYGGAIWTTGKIGKALKFDGVNDYVEVPDSNSLDITGKITMEAWIYPYNVSKTDYQVIVQKYNYSGPPYNGAYYLGLGGYGYTNKILLGLSHNGYNFYYTLSNTNITANTWTHVAATSNGTHMIIYINGVKDKVAAYSPGVIYASAAPLRIGCFLPELGVKRFFDGVIDEVRVSAGTIWTVDDDKMQCPNADFASIQAAINAASSDDTIIVHDGNYNEALYINKCLTIKAASTPVIKGCQMRATNYGNRQATIFVEDADSVILEGLDVEGQGLGVPGGTKSYAIIYENSHGTIRDCIVSPNTMDDMYSAAIAAWDNSDVTIESCLVQNFGRIGIYSNNATLAIQSNTIIGQVYNLDNKVNYGIEIEDYTGASIAKITNNEIYNCDNTHPSPLWSSCAIIVDIWRGFYDLPSSKVSIENNNIHHNFEAIEIVSNALSYAHYNDIHNNRYGAWVDPDLYNNYAIFDARFNWWGDASGPNQTTTNPSGLGNDAGDYVDYSPWLGATFKIKPRTYHVNPTGTIQEAIDEAASGDTILIHSGTYNEALYIKGKSLKIKAASTPIIQGSSLFTTNYGVREAVIFVENAVNVILEGLDIEGLGFGSGAPKSYGVIYEESTGIIRSCIVSTNMIGDMYDVGIAAWDSSSLTVYSCTVKNFGRIGIFYYDGCNGGVYSSTIEGQVYNNEDYVNYGIEIETYSYPCNIEIARNEIYNCDNLHPAPKWSSAGIVIDGWLGQYAVPSSEVAINNNEIHDNYYGIEVVANPLSYAHYNNIYNNREYGVIQDPDYAGNNATFDATYNWWGHNTGPYHATSWMHMGSPYGPHYGLGDNVSDYVLYDPWLEYYWPAPPPTIKVEPPISQMQMLNKTFSVNITINDLSVGYKAVGVQFRLCYNSTLLQFVDATEGPFMQDPRWNLYETFFLYYNETPIKYGPSVIVGILLLPNDTGCWNAFPSGSGVLATITFKTLVQEAGLEKPPLTCSLTLIQTLIVDAGEGEIPHNLQHGVYRMYPNHIGDFNWDYIVDMKDIRRAAKAFGTYPGHERWDPICDTNGDDLIDMKDIRMVAKGFGWTLTYDP
jgi:hypothetical protein